MSDESPEQPKRRPGRPRKKRHDPVDAPVDGNYGCDVVLNKEKGYQYALVSEDDMPTMLGRGATVCKRDSEQAKPFFDVRKDSGEADFRVKGLTLMKISDELYNRAQAPALAIAKQRMSALKRNATAQIGNGQFASIAQHEYGRNQV